MTSSLPDLLWISIDCWPEAQVLPEGPLLPSPLALLLEAAMVEGAMVAVVIGVVEGVVEGVAEGVVEGVAEGVSAGGAVVVAWPPAFPAVDDGGT